MKSKRTAADHSKRRRPAMAGHQPRQRRCPRPIPAQHLSARRQHQHTAAAAAARPDDEITPGKQIKFNLCEGLSRNPGGRSVMSPAALIFCNRFFSASLLPSK
jgi:hypothetical protein